MGHLEQREQHKEHDAEKPLANSSQTIDTRIYSYTANSNRLMSVGDAVSSPDGGVGDFKDGNTNGDDYAYDNSGSLI